MRHRLAGRHLGRDSAHRRALYRNLVTDLLRYERITTTEAKAKEIRPIAERIITLGKRGDLHARRQAARFVYDPGVVEHVFDDIAGRMADRPGGYTRITKLEPRKGDGANMATIELIDYVIGPATPRPERVTASPTATLAPLEATGPDSDHEAAEDVIDEATADLVDEADEDVADEPVAEAQAEEPEAVVEDPPAEPESGPEPETVAEDGAAPGEDGEQKES
ncbi:MAG: 50S ribosomal protein L17 [Dehalococcoidia bacterium]